MLARYVFLAVITLGALAAAANFAPGNLERLAMLERDGRNEQAMVELQSLYDAGERHPQVMLRLYNLKARFGLVDDARIVLEEYAKQRPGDIEAQIGLIRFYQNNQLETPYVTALRSLAERTRSRELLNELLGFFRMTGRFREEEELLERTARANRASAAEFERLGLLAASRGDLQRAVRALRRADGRLDEQSRPARVGLFRVLIELKETEEAHQRSVAWLRSWREPDLAVEFMDALTDAGRMDLALDIGGRFGGPDNDVTLVMAELLHEQGRNDEALRKLKEFAASGTPEQPERTQRLIAVAAAAGDPAMALRAARQIGLRKIDASVVIDLLDSLFDTIEADTRAIPAELLRGFSSEIDARIQNASPVGQEATDRLVLSDDMRLFASHLAILDNDRDLARRHLAAIDPDRLGAGELSRWTELQLASGLRSTVFPNLPRQWRRQPGDPAPRRVRGFPRPERVVAGETAPAKSKPGDPPAGPAAGAGSGPREAQIQQASPTESTSGRARRLRRQTAALERRRERARLSAQRREQLQQGTPPKSSTAPAASKPLQPGVPSTGGGG